MLSIVYNEKILKKNKKNIKNNELLYANAQSEWNLLKNDF